MPKDPRFNFYPDNWSGGTRRMTFMQKGAYMELILLNFYCFSDGLPGFTENEAMDVLAPAEAYADLWNFLKPKFKTDGKYFWSDRMQKEFFKAKKHSEKQAERAANGWEKRRNDATANATASNAAMPVNGTGIGIGLEEKKEPEKVLTKEAVDAIAGIAEYFEVTTDVLNPQYNLIHHFVETIYHRNELPRLTVALAKYMAYKARSNGIKHGIKSWVGTREKHYHDGEWTTNDWQKKLENYDRQTDKGKASGTGSVIESGKAFGNLRSRNSR